MTIEERLSEQLDQKDEKISELNQQIEDLASKLDAAEGAWTIPDKVDDVASLPLPRLEYRWAALYENEDGSPRWGEFKVTYSLVYMHLVDEVKSIALGITTIRSGNSDRKPWQPYADERHVNLPFRDGVHGHHDAAHLGLPLYAITPDGATYRLDGDGYENARRTGNEHRRGAT